MHIAYTRYGSTRLSCAACVLARERDLMASASCAGNAALFGTLVDLEARSTFSFQPGQWLADVVFTADTGSERPETMVFLPLFQKAR